MDFGGAKGVGLMGRLFRSREWWRLVPEQSVVASAQGEGEDHVQAALADERSFAVAYLPIGNPVTIQTDRIAGPQVRASWYDPRTGASTPAPLADGDATPQIHAHLKEHDLLPKEHLVDTGYLDAQLLLGSQKDDGVDLVGPTRGDDHWQGRADEGFAAKDFTVDWDAQEVTCPAGHTNHSGTPAVDNRGTNVIKVKFSSKDCSPCAFRPQCFRSSRRSGRQALTLRPRDLTQALLAAREREKTADFGALYDQRAGIGPDPARPRLHGGGSQLPPVSRMVRPDPTTQDPNLSLCALDEPTPADLTQMTSPAVSQTGESQFRSGFVGISGVHSVYRVGVDAPMRCLGSMKCSRVLGELGYRGPSCRLQSLG
jgi:hypothetical protein